MRSRGNAVGELKKKLLPVYRRAARLYRRRLEGRRTVIRCMDGYHVEIAWARGSFMHLCGVTGCDRPPHIIHADHAPGEAEYFYEQLSKSKGSLSSRDMVIADPRAARRKARVLERALGLGADIIAMVDSDKPEVQFYFGGEEWCLGIQRDEPTSLREGHDVYFPRSLRRQSVTERRLDGTRLHIVTAIDTR